MYEKQSNDTQPARTARVKKKGNLSWLIWVLLAGSTLLVLGFAGVYGGYRVALQTQHRIEATESVLSVKDQFELGLQDFQSGQYDLARQRFEWVRGQDPNYPGASDKLAEVEGILYATATPTPLPPTPTLTPTPDLRPIEDLYNQVRDSFAEGNWTGTIDAIVNLRKADPAFHVTEVDGMLYQALRTRGVERIKGSDLEGGIYDLALAERFGPLDGEAQNWRELARLYMYGSAFWEAYPERAVYYFGQLASAAPGLRDASGWTARERYYASLIQYGDQLARNGDWCAANSQYELVLSMGGSGQVAPTAAYAQEQCYTPTPEPTSTPTETPPATETPTEVILPSETPTLEPTAIIPEMPTSTFTPEVTEAPLPTETFTPEVLPTEAPTIAPTEEPSPTETVATEAVVSLTETPAPVETEAP
jgi:hypothetical protein